MQASACSLRSMKQAQRFDHKLRQKDTLTDFKPTLQQQQKTLQVVLASEVQGEHKPDVSINISSSDLAGVLKVGCEDDDHVMMMMMRMMMINFSSIDLAGVLKVSHEDHDYDEDDNEEKEDDDDDDQLHKQ